MVREAAHGLAERGYKIEVLTTCAQDHFTWANEFPPGVTRDGAVTVRRFPAVQNRDHHRWSRLQERLLSGEQLDEPDELAWSNGRFRVPDLYLYLSGHAQDYAAIVFSPYLFWTTLYCAGIAPERTVLMPCLHDEPYAYLRSVAAALASAAVVWFLSEPEHQLAHRLAPVASHHAVVGAAVKIPESYDPDGFRKRHDLIRPYVLYAGRREGGKGWQELMAGFGLAVSRHHLPFDLVTVGRRPRPGADFARAPDRRSWLPRACRGTGRVRRRRRLRAAEREREFFAHNHGGLARRNGRHRQRGQQVAVGGGWGRRWIRAWPDDMNDGSAVRLGWGCGVLPGFRMMDQWMRVGGWR